MSLRRPFVRLTLLALLFVALLSWARLEMYEALTPDRRRDMIDLAVMNQLLRSTLQGEPFRQTVHDIPGNLGDYDHTSYFLLLVLPLYALFPGPRLLLLLMPLAAAAGALLAYALARDMTRNNKTLAAALAAALLLSPVMIHPCLDDFRPVFFTVPLYLGALLAWRRDRFAVFLVLILLALSTREEVSIQLLLLALFLRGRGAAGKYGLSAAIVGAASFLLLFGVFSGFEISYIARAEPTGESLSFADLGEIRWEVLLLSPLYALPFLFLLPGPVLSIGLMRPLSVLPALPVIAFVLLTDPSRENIHSYYHLAPAVPFLFYGLCEAAAAWSEKRKEQSASHGKLAPYAVALAALLTLGIDLATSDFFEADLYRPTEETRAAVRYVEKLPEEVGVSTDLYLLAAASSRSFVAPYEFIVNEEGGRCDIDAPEVDLVMVHSRD